MGKMSRTHADKKSKPSKCRLSTVLPLFLCACISFNLLFVVKYYRSVTPDPARTNDISKIDAPLLLNPVREVTKGIDSDHKEPKQRLAPIPVPVRTAKASETSQTKPVVVAHVVSLIKCSKKAAVTGFLDAAAVLRHSIHKQSVHTGASAYSYKMYAIVHENCKDHAHVLDRLGYTALVKPSPVLLDDMKPGWYRDHVEGENCCGADEFIKLYAYTLLEHPIAVHWDMDVAIFKPMDDLFDSMLYTQDSPMGRQSRAKLQLQHSERPLPKFIDAFFTRDITSAQPWETRQGVQGGFLVARPSMHHFETYLAFIKGGNYTKGRGNVNGWGGLGYGGFQGAMAYQGAVAYFYDQFVPDTAVELNACVWNQAVADVVWRGPTRMEHYKQCREYRRPGDSFEDNTPENGKCEDCRVTPIDKVNSAHYTACKKPWECLVPTPRVPKDKAQVERLQELTNKTTCGLLFRKWFDLRQEFEDQLQAAGGVEPSPKTGTYRAEYFGGYCAGVGNYIPMNPPPENFDIKKMYGV